MMANSEIWVAFGRMFGMLVVVLAMMLLMFYLIRRFGSRGATGPKNLIRTLAVHHLSPKEKLVLVEAMDEVILIGVTPTQISAISKMNPDGLEKPGAPGEEPVPDFSHLFSGMMKSAGLVNTGDNPRQTGDGIAHGAGTGSRGTGGRDDADKKGTEK